MPAPTGRRERLLVPAAVLALLAAVPAVLAHTLPRRAIVVSFDGAGGLDLAARLKDGSLGPDGFARAAREGFRADRLAVVTPSLTAVSHAAISAGAPPSKTGIVANWFHPARAPLDVRVNAFEAESEVETIWEAAARQGKRVATLTWPGVSFRSPRTSTPVGLRYDDVKAHGVFWKGTSAELADLGFALPLGVPTFSPPKTFRVGVSENHGSARKATFRFVLLDTSDDGRRNYDQLVAVSPTGEVVAKARAGEWFALTGRRETDGDERDVLSGRWCKVRALAPDLSVVSIYVGNGAQNDARPSDFRRTLDRHAGFWPGPPDSGFLLEPIPDVASFVEMTARFAEFFVRAFETADRRGDWDLLLAYQPILDEAEHVATLTDPRQPSYTRERAASAAALLRDVWRIADRAAAAYLRFRDRGDIVFVSDHGMRPIVRSLYVQELLRRRGWLTVERGPRGGLHVAARSPVDAAVGGGVAFVVINRDDRLTGGVVPPEKADALMAEMETGLQTLTDDEGERVFETVVPRAGAAVLGLDHPNAGDLVLVTADGTMVRSGFPPGGDSASLFGEAENPGQHGFGPDPQLDGIFFHVGDGIEPGRVPEFRAIDVAARVAGRLGISPPGAPGRAQDQ